MLIICLSSYDGIVVYFVYTLQDDQDRQVTLACGPLGVEVLMGNIQTIQIHWWDTGVQEQGRDGGMHEWING